MLDLFKSLVEVDIDKDKSSPINAKENRKNGAFEGLKKMKTRGLERGIRVWGIWWMKFISDIQQNKWRKLRSTAIVYMYQSF